MRALTRSPGEWISGEGMENDNADMVLLPSELFKDTVYCIYSINETLKEKIQASKNYNESVNWAIDHSEWN